MQATTSTGEPTPFTLEALLAWLRRQREAGSIHHDEQLRYPGETAYEKLVSSSSNAEWQQLLTTAPRFIQYVECDVIGNPAAFGKLTF